jgi:anti-sigma regulatory factor (Ser/Thr protein kinase)
MSAIAAPTTFDHRLLVHDGDDEYLAAMLPFAREGLALGEAVVVVDDADRLQTIASALGSDGDAIRFEEGDRWWHGPWRTFAAYERSVRELLESHPAVRAIAHPTWLADEANREWRRFESFANLHFDGWPYRSLCSYDRAALGAEVCAEARATHPLLHVDGGTAPCRAYVDPHRFVATCVRDLPPAPPDLRLDVGSVDDLLDARRAVGEWTHRRAGTSGVADRLVLAMNELASNALRHGGGEARVELALHGDTVLMEVVDAGADGLDPLAPYRPPVPDLTGGRGLWIAATLCDEIDIRPGPDVNRVRCLVDV